MTPTDKARWIQKKLQELFPHPQIPLQHTSPYTLLIAVLLSAQCTDARVNLVTPHLFAKADTAEKMARLGIDQIADLIRSCGLHAQKAQAISNLSKILVKKFGGKVPCSWDDLESLPGVGHKTASVVMVQAFHQTAFPVDTHIHRLAHRWGLSSGKNVMQTEKDLKSLFPEDAWADLHLQMIYYGRQYCPAKRHDKNKCPICSHVAQSR